MNPEPLRGKVKKDLYGRIRFEFDDVKYVAEFYKEYTNLPSYLRYKHPELKSELKYFFTDDDYNVRIDRKDDYNKWLFNYCFADVIK